VDTILASGAEDEKARMGERGAAKRCAECSGQHFPSTRPRHQGGQRGERSHLTAKAEPLEGEGPHLAKLSAGNKATLN
jgi:hypothetical protein